MSTLTMPLSSTDQTAPRTKSDLQSLQTERPNEASEGLDTKSAIDIARIINHEDAKIAAAVKKSAARDCDGHRHRSPLPCAMAAASSTSAPAPPAASPHFDAAECPPTFSTAPQQVQYIMAGGPKALASASDVNEDSPEIGQRDIARRRPTRKDIVIGVSASGRTPYVVGATEYARARGAKTAAITCNPNSDLSQVADITICAEVGPEIISGSTRMKSSTAQKMICNMITTGAMTRLGYVYDNLMVNVHMKNAKLVERGIRVLMKVCNIDRETAIRTIKSAGKSIPIAVVMLKAGVDKMEAVRRLQKSDGNVRLAIDDSRLDSARL